MLQGGEGTFLGWDGCFPDPVDCPVHVLHLDCVVDKWSQAVVCGQQCDFPVSAPAFLWCGLWLVEEECGLSPDLSLITKLSFSSMGTFFKCSTQQRMRTSGVQAV